MLFLWRLFAEQLVLFSYPVAIFWRDVTPVERHMWHRRESSFTLTHSRSSRFFSPYDRRGNKPGPGCWSQWWIKMWNQHLRLMNIDGTTEWWSRRKRKPEHNPRISMIWHGKSNEVWSAQRWRSIKAVKCWQKEILKRCTEQLYAFLLINKSFY